MTKTRNTNDPITNKYQPFIEAIEESLSLFSLTNEVSKADRVKLAATYAALMSLDLKPLQKQLERLKRNEFIVAIIGLENSGKSTFLNACLEDRLLPAKAERCTRTPVKIFSAATNEACRVEVSTLNQEEYEEKLQALNDSEPIDRTLAESLIEEGLHSDGLIRYSDLSSPELRSLLEDLVTCEVKSLAIDEIRLFTNKLVREDGIVFCDAPGVNSGETQHVEDTKSLLANCDAVVFVQDCTNASLTDWAQKLSDYIAENDPEVGHRKTFFFLNKIDSVRDRETYLQIQKTAKTEIQEKCPGILESNIVFGAADRHLDLLEDQSDSSATLNLQKLYDVVETTDASATGVQEIKLAIQQFISDDRIPVLQQRLARTLNEIKRHARKVLEFYTEDGDVAFSVPDAEKLAKDKETRAFNEWWNGHFESVVAKLDRHIESRLYENAIRLIQSPSQNKDDGFPDVPERVSVLVKKTYVDYLPTRLANLASLEPEAIDNCFRNSNKLQPFTRQDGESALRKRVYDELINILEDMSLPLASELQAEADKFRDAVMTAMWRSNAVTRQIEEILGDFQIEVKIGFQALMSRFARPLAQLHIASSPESELRSSLIEKFKNDSKLVESYAKRNEEFEPDMDYRKFYPPRSQQQQAIKSVEKDICIFVKLMISGGFEAIGFEAFCEQKLLRLFERFKDVGRRGHWQSIAQNDFRNKVPSFLCVVPPGIKFEVEAIDLAEKLCRIEALVNKQKSFSLRQ